MTLIKEEPLTIFDIERIAQNPNFVKFNHKSAKKEYATGGFFGDKETLLILNHRGDYLSRKFGRGIIKKMLRDPEIMKCLMVIVVSTLSDGVNLFPALPKPMPVPIKKSSPERIKEREQLIAKYETAKKYSDFCTRAIDNLEKSFRETLKTMLFSTLSYGNKVAEQTYKEIDDKEFNRTLLTLSSIKVKPYDSVAFVVDVFDKLVGFKTFHRVVIEDREGKHSEIKEEILPREKFLVLTYRGEDEDVRGTSILEHVYNAWMLKMQMWPEYLRWLLVSAVPALVGYLPPNEQRHFVRDENGEIVRDVDGNPIYEAEIDALLNAMQDIRNNTCIALPNGAKVEPITLQVNGDPFKGMRDVLNEEIEMGLILQTLATSEGKFMARAAAETHASVLEIFIADIKNMVADMIRNDVLKPLMRINFGEESLELLPKVSLVDTERRNWEKTLTAVSQAFKDGYIGKSQKVGYDRIIGAPDRDLESDDEFEESQTSRKAVETQRPPIEEEE